MVGFETTHWSVVKAAGGTNPNDSTHASLKADALEKLLKTYRPALVSHIIIKYRRRREDAEDIVQSFVAKKFLEDNVVENADAAKGRFRTFLLTILDRFAIDWIRREKNKRHGGGAQHEPDGGLSNEPSPEIPDEVYREWAIGLLDRTKEAMQRLCEEDGRLALWRVFVARVLTPCETGAEPVPLSQLVEELGLPSTTRASNLLVTAKRMYDRVLTDVIKEYALTDEQVEQEKTELIKALSRRM